MTLGIHEGLKNLVNTFELTWDHKNPKKGIKRALEGLHLRIDHLEKKTNEIFSNDIDKVVEWSIRIKNIKFKLENCENFLGIPDKEKKDFLAHLHLLTEDCEKNKNSIEELLKNHDIDNNKKLEDLTDYCVIFGKEKTKNLKLFDEIYIKLKKLKLKTESQDPILKNNTDAAIQLLSNLTLRINKTVQEEDISDVLKKSFEEDIQQLKSYEDLKKSCVTTLINYNTLENEIQKSLFTLKTIPIISELNYKLHMEKRYFESLESELESISIQTVAKDFVEKYQAETTIPKLLTKEDHFFIRDLSQFFTDIDLFNVSLKEFADHDNNLTKLSESIILFSPKIKEALIKISQQIKSIEDKEEPILDFVDEDLVLLLENKKFGSIQQLKQLQQEIEQKWNLICMNLNELKNQRDNFIKFKSITQRMGLCHLLAEKIQGRIRNLRRTENDRDIHIQEFNQLTADFKELTKFITENINDNCKYFVNEQDTENFSDKFYPKVIKNKKNHSYESQPEKSCEVLSLKDEYNNLITTLKEEIKADLAPENIGLVWISEERKIEICKAYQEQVIAFAEKLKKYQENIEMGFSITLPEMCRIMTNDINREGNTIKDTKDPYYNDRFTEAYFSESRTGQAVQVIGGSLASALKYCGNAAMNTVNKQLGYVQNTQQDELQLPNEPFDFEPVQSPFDQMKQII